MWHSRERKFKTNILIIMIVQGPDNSKDKTWVATFVIPEPELVKKKVKWIEAGGKVIFVLAIATLLSDRGGGNLSHMNNIQLMRSMTLAFVGIIYTLINTNLMDHIRLHMKSGDLIIDFLCNSSLESFKFLVFSLF